MASKGKVTTDPLTWADVAQRVELARRLVALSAEQSRQAQLNADLARLGLAELETDLRDLSVRGLKGGQP